MGKVQSKLLSYFLEELRYVVGEVGIRLPPGLLVIDADALVAGNILHQTDLAVKPLDSNAVDCFPITDAKVKDWLDRRLVAPRQVELLELLLSRMIKRDLGADAKRILVGYR